MPKIQFYNSLSKRSENPVKGTIGNYDKAIKTWVETADDSDPDSFVFFQVSTVWQSTIEAPKPNGNGTNGIAPNVTKWGKNYPKKSAKDETYNGIDWHTVYAPISVVVDLIKQGYCLRFGVKEGGNSIDHFITSQMLAFDLDNEDHLLSIEQTLEVCDNNLIAPLMIYYSPSGSPEFPKLRLIVAFDSPCSDYKRLRSIARRIRSVFPNATHADDPCRYFFGTIRPDEAYSNLVTRNNLETLESSLPESTEDEEVNDLVNTSEMDQSTVNKRFLTFFRERVLDAVMNGDPTALIDHWVNYLNQNEEGNLFTGEWFDRGSQNGSLNSWNGTDPIRGSTTGKGDSFVISIQPDFTITFNRDHGSFGGDLVDLYYYLRSGSWDVPKQSPVQWRKTIDEICNIHTLESFNVLDRVQQREYKGLPGFVIEDSKGRTKIDLDALMTCFFQKWEGKIFYCYDNERFQVYENNKWSEYKSNYVVPLVRELVKEADLVFNRDELGSFWTASLINQISTYLTKSIPDDIIREPLNHDLRYMPFTNGLFDCVTKELIDFTPEVFNTFIHPFDYEYTDDKPKDIFLRAYRKICDVPEAAEAVLNWMICAVQGRAYETKLILSMVGQSRSGKTTVAEILERCVHVDATVRLDADVLFKESERFAMTALRSKALLVLDEFLGFPIGTSVGKFKKLIPGNDSVNGVTLSTDTKGGNHITFKFKGGVITTSENIPNFRGTIDEGTKNRFFWVTVHRCKEDLTSEFYYLMNSKELLCWIVQQNTDELIDEYFPNIKKKEWVKQADHQAILSSNRYVRFLEECLEYSVENTRGMKAVELFNHFRDWCNDQGEKPGTNTLFGREITKAMMERWKVEQPKVKKNDGWVYQFVKLVDMKE